MTFDYCGDKNTDKKINQIEITKIKRNWFQVKNKINKSFTILCKPVIYTAASIKIFWDAFFDQFGRNFSR